MVLSFLCDAKQRRRPPPTLLLLIIIPHAWHPLSQDRSLRLVLFGCFRLFDLITREQRTWRDVRGRSWHAYFPRCPCFVLLNCVFHHPAGFLRCDPRHVHMLRRLDRENARLDPVAATFGPAQFAPKVEGPGRLVRLSHAQNAGAAPASDARSREPFLKFYASRD